MIRAIAERQRILERALESKDFRTALQAIRSAVDVIREARAHTELKGEITGELNQQANPGGGIIFLPVMVPAGTVGPLNVQLDPAAMRQALSEQEKAVSIESFEVSRPQFGRQLLYGVQSIS